MRLRVLGPLEVVDEGHPVALAAAKPRTLLAALAVQRGAPVAVDELIDALWGEAPPPSAPKLLQVYVSQLRQRLPTPIRIETTPGGYALRVPDDDVDVARFERLVHEGRAALRAGNATLSAAVLQRALDLWRGPAYADVRYEEFARDEVERLEGLRELARADRIDADLRLGRHAAILGELRGLLAHDPTDERLAAQTMLAAYRAIGAAETLDVFARVRQALQDELGASPDPTLTALADRIARGDPSLREDPAPDPATPRLPIPSTPLIGREREVAELRALLDRPSVRLVSLTGAGGSGKSRLALELAHQGASRFANGVVVVELASLGDPELVLPTIARALGIDPGTDPHAALAAALVDLELLLVLDNIEHLRAAAPDVVRLLAEAPRLVVVATTRVVLHVSGEHVYPVDPLPETDAVALFAARAAARDRTFVLDATTTGVVASICRRLDGLPLPIELAAARVRSLGLGGLDARLGSRLAVLTSGPRDLPARQQTLRETLDWSANLLSPREADVFARLAVFPFGCTADAAEIVARADDDILETLVDHHLVQSLEIDGERRFRLLETIREYAYGRLGDDRAATETRLVDWMVTVVEDADLIGDLGPRAEALRRIDHEIDTLRAAFGHASQDESPTRELSLAGGVWRYWWSRGLLVEGRAILDDIVARRGLVPTTDGIRTVRAAGSLAWSLGEPEVATELATRAMVVADEIDDHLERYATRNLIGVVATLQGELDIAVNHLNEAIAIADEMDQPYLTNTARLNLGIALWAAGRLDDARARITEVLDYRTQENHTEGIGFARLNLGEIEYAADDLEAAEAHFRAATDAFTEVGFKARIANGLQGLAAVEARTGRAASAARRLGRAAVLIGDIGWGADGTALAPAAERAAREALGDERFDEFFAEGRAEVAMG